MTEYNRIFTDAFDRITPASDDADFIRGIVERADKMEKERKTTNSTVYRAAEQPTPQVEYKPRKAPVIAGVAAITAAAAGIGFFAGGGNFGNFQFIPLKEGGGAGYSANADTAAITTSEDVSAAFTTSTGVHHIIESDDVSFTTAVDNIPESDSFVIGDYRVDITSYNFNTVTLELYYTVTRTDGGSIDMDAINAGTNTGFPVILSYLDDNTQIGKWQTEVTDTSVSFISKIVADEPAHSIDVIFEADGTSDRKTFTATCDNSNYVFRLPCDIEGVDPHISDLFISESNILVKYKILDTDTYRPGQMDVSGVITEPVEYLSDGGSLITSAGDIGFKAPVVNVYMQGDYPISYADSAFSALNVSDFKGYIYRGFAEMCDISQIARVDIDGVTVYDNANASETTYPAAADTDSHTISVGGSWEGHSFLGFTGNEIAMTGWEYDGRILKVQLVGTLEDFSHVAIRSTTNPRNILQTHNRYDAETGTGIFYAILDVPAGEYDTVEFIDLGADMTGNYPEAGISLTINGIEDREPLMERVGRDMTEYCMPGLTLEWLTLSPFGLELSFTSEEQFNAPEIRVDITSLNGTTFQNSGYYSLSLLDENTGIHHISVIIVPEDYMTDLTQMREFSINGLKTKRAEFMAKSFWDIPESGNELTPVETAVQVLDIEE